MLRIVIPARYQSSRFPGKLLQKIGGIPMIVHVYQRALEAKVDSVIVATDDQRIAEAVTGVGAEVFFSTTEHHSGTERITEVVAALKYHDDDIVINLQGDEPFVPAKLLRQVAQDLAVHEKASMATLYIPLEDEADVFNPNVVKVALDKENYALYFSRAPIPWLRSGFDISRTNFALDLFHRHLGIYAYRVGFIKRYGQLPISPLEKQEALEQLRVLWNGYKIILSAAEKFLGQEVNTSEDLAKARAIYADMSGLG